VTRLDHPINSIYLPRSLASSCEALGRRDDGCFITWFIGPQAPKKKGPIAQCAIGPNDPDVSAIRRRLLCVSGGKSLGVRVASNGVDWDDRLRFDAISLKEPDFQVLYTVDANSHVFTAGCAKRVLLDQPMLFEQNDPESREPIREIKSNNLQRSSQTPRTWNGT
jgi:hypothetical protein